MSQAGKFIPGGGGNKAKGARTGPIRAPDSSAVGATGTAPLGKPPGGSSPKPFGKGSLRKPVAKSQKLPIVIMSAFVCCMLVSVAWYTLAYLPAKRQNEQLIQQHLDDLKRMQDEKDAAAEAEKERLQKLATERGTLTVDSVPTGATATIGDFHQSTPASFKDIIPGPITLVIHMDGYEDYRQDLTITADKPSDLGTVQLVQKTGNLSITSPQNGVTYTITGPAGYTHDGKLPDKLEKLPIGDYSITATQKDWKLAPVTVSVHAHDNLQKEIKFPYANISLTSVPPGATVRQGNKVMGQTPLTLNQVHPGDLHVSVDLPPYTIQKFDLHVPDFGNVIKQVKLDQGKDFIAASGLPMVWINDGGFWAGKYEVRQSDFNNVTGYNPSTFHSPNRPVETISWESAQAYIDKLNKFEQKAGKLPAGFHYALPKESQWDTLNDDSDLDQSATSRVNALTSTQDAGYSEPNKYGIYDTLGNVWEWCLDDYDDKGDHSLRGGCWLSSTENFSGAANRQGGGPKYADKFTGLRVVLVPN